MLHVLDGFIYHFHTAYELSSVYIYFGITCIEPDNSGAQVVNKINETKNYFLQDEVSEVAAGSWNVGFFSWVHSSSL